MNTGSYLRTAVDAGRHRSIPGAKVKDTGRDETWSKLGLSAGGRWYMQVYVDISYDDIRSKRELY